MLSREQNERLTRVGAGTPLGSLLRRYWFPVAAVCEFDNQATKRVRLLGEDLVVYRDRSGSFGAMTERCPHRGASMAFGIPDERGLRCAYHGWLFDASGACLEQPHEPPEHGFKECVRARAYPVVAVGGVLFAYLGSGVPPHPPAYEALTDPSRKRALRHALLPCNWLQIMENSLDPAHLEWLHGHFLNYRATSRGEPPVFKIKRQVRFGFDASDVGIVKRRLIEGETQDTEDWRIGQLTIFPNVLRIANHRGVEELQFRVPVDDEHTWQLWYRTSPSELCPDDPDLSLVPAKVRDRDGNFDLDTLDGQDAMAWVTQGPIADRTREHLGVADQGIILFRRMLEANISRVERGEAPLGVYGDATEASAIRFPARTECTELFEWVGTPPPKWP